ncbi:hypothetical protein BD324DRAFT_616140 [Kockovaella imperatae]|uniref:protein-tyrosine-phosphatase n=1 Tax=Kockovaella imperatae TaxID=4999 RepID=A0A1Y1URG2_9TREE|nr:hypothetical protein BD324DRAFT_616140 [Kockovaella imperatae]ORX40074.1 hypothetical protein BD324DRAFT_616140 [Kockovaella imperatae]
MTLQPDQKAGPIRPRLPGRTSSTRSYQDDPAPSDSAKSDDDAITDVYKSVEQTGSLEAAAKKLQQIAVARAWEDDAEEAAYLAQSNQAWQDEEEDNGNGDYDDDEDGYGYGYGYGHGQQRDDQDQEDIVHLQEIVPGLWVGDLVAAMDAPGLEERGITNILSCLRPSLEFSNEFSVYPLEIDDHADTDILSHLPSCVAWINDAMDKKQRAEQNEAGEELPGAEEIKAINEGRSNTPTTRSKLIDPRAGITKPGSVLVHCQAGMSRSATVAAAYLMRVLNIGPVEAVELIQEKRPVVSPSDTFWYQLGLFHNADGRVSLRDRSTRQYYMERTTNEFMNGNGGAPAMDKMAKYPATPTLSRPATPAGTRGRRKIRCKACRRELAVREHMMDHILDQAPTSRPRTPSEASLNPHRSSFSFGSGFTSVDPSKNPSQPTSRRPSIISEVINPLTGKPGATRSRQPSMSLSMTSAHPSPAQISSIDKDKERVSPGVPSPGGLPYPKTGTGPNGDVRDPDPSESSTDSKSSKPFPSSDSSSNSRSYLTADQLANRLPPHLQALRTRKISMSDLTSPFNASPASSPERESPAPPPGPVLTKSADSVPRLSASPAPASPAPESPSSPVALGRSKSIGAGERRASDRSTASGRRLSTLAMTPAEGLGRRTSLSDRRGSIGVPGPSGPPILVNPKCSGYFVEPLTWMEPILQKGDISGKIVCPNEKCGVKLGNFDWAGVQCGCKEWVTPGFCIHRSKVDEVF